MGGFWIVWIVSLVRPYFSSNLIQALVAKPKAKVLQSAMSADASIATGSGRAAIPVVSCLAPKAEASSEC
jgi:hypothetical protein